MTQVGSPSTADRLGRIASAATAGDVGEPWTTVIRCERRPSRRPCSGFIEIAIIWDPPENNVLFPAVTVDAA